MKRGHTWKRGPSRRRPEFEGQLWLLWGMVALALLVAIFILASDMMVELVGTELPFTLFAPTDAVLLRSSGLFRKYPDSKPKADVILSRLLGYAAVARPLPTSAVPVGGFVRLESISGFTLLAGRSKDKRFRVNGVPCRQVDLVRGNLVMHLVDELLAPEDFLDAVASADPDDLRADELAEHARNGTGGPGADFDEDPDIAEQKVSTRPVEGSVRAVVGSWIAKALGSRLGAADTGEEQDSDTRNRDDFVKEGNELLDTADEGQEREHVEAEAEAAVEEGVGSLDTAEEKKEGEETASEDEDRQALADDAPLKEGGEDADSGGEEDPMGAGKNGTNSTGLSHDALQGTTGPRLLGPGLASGVALAERGVGVNGTVSAGQSEDGDEGQHGEGAGAGAEGSRKDEYDYSEEEGEENLSTEQSKSKQVVPADPVKGEEGAVREGKGEQVSSETGPARPEKLGAVNRSIPARDSNEAAETRQGAVAGQQAGEAKSATSNAWTQAAGRTPGAAGSSFRWFSNLGFGGGAAGKVVKEAQNATAQNNSAPAGPGGKDLRGSAKPIEVALPARKDPPCSGRGRMIGGMCVCSILFQGPQCAGVRETGELAVEGYEDDLVINREQLAFLESASAKENNNTLASSGGLIAKLLGGLKPRVANELRQLVPAYDPFDSQLFDTCAVVGSSGSLLLKEAGAEIDSNDMVMRFNGAPTRGFEKQVGSKTTYRLSQVEWAGFKEANESVIYHLWLRAQHADIEHIVRFKRMFPEGPLLVLDVGYLTQVFNALGTMPSIGYVGFSLALQRCRRVALYGFYLGERHGVKHHYYDKNATAPHSEDLDKEFASAWELAEAEYLWVADQCLYDCRRSAQRCSLCLRVPLSQLGQRAEWTEEQKILNARREESWREFQQWEKFEKEEGYLKIAKEKRKKAQRARKKRETERQKRIAQGKSTDALDEGTIPWGRLISEDALEHLTVEELLIYFRENHVVIPPTKLEMAKAIHAHYYFEHRHLEKHRSRIYVPSD
eukprot:jgi/Mesen1/4317/ME000022S03606